MGKLTASRDFYARKQERIADAQKKLQGKKIAGDTTTTSGATNVADVADNLAEIKIKTPTEQIQDRIPVVEEGSTVPLGTYEGRAEILGKIGEEIDPVATQKKALESIGGTTVVESDAKGTDLYGDVSTVPGQKKVDLYKEQLADEAQMRIPQDEQSAKLLGEMVDIIASEDYGRKQTSEDEETPQSLFGDMLDFAAKTVQTDQTKFNLFGKLVDTSTAGSEVDINPMSFLQKNSDEISYALKGVDKLDMLEDRSDINSGIRPEVGRAALIATILELTHRLNQQASETDKELNERQYENAMDRINIGKAIGSRMERLLYPSADIDPNKPYTGESEGFGYKYRTTERERSLVGQAFAQGFADSPNFSFMESHFVKAKGEDKGKWTFRPDRKGDQQLWAIRRALRDVLGLKDYTKPVSLVPTTKEGRLIGEGAFDQKQITSQVLPNELPPIAKKAIQKLGRVGHTTSPHKILLMSGMLNSNNSFLMKVRKADTAYYQKKKKEFLDEYTARAANDPDFIPQELGDFDTFEQAANKQTIEIMERHKEMRQYTVIDAINRMDRSFFYGYTAINNSSRLMITNQELNYQADKVARFLVDGAKPVIFKKNTNSDLEMSSEGFMGVIARCVIPEAGKMPPERQVALLLQDLSDPAGSKYLKLGRELLEYTQNNSGYIGAVRGTKQAKDYAATYEGLRSVTPLELSPELTEYLQDMGKDEFYFAMDALHELARWDATPTGAEFKTRVKAEADGNANGATILATQMGVKNIMEKGGVLYSKKRIKYLAQGLSHSEIEEIEKDIRDDVYTHMQALPEISKDPKKWDMILQQIKKAGKVKELMKQPIMTSIYGKDPRFHSDTARKFIVDNPEYFASFDSEAQAEKELTKMLEHALVTGLGGALEHAAIAKRLGRAFNFANRIAMVEGPNGFMSQAGGYEYIEDTPEPTAFDFVIEGMTDENTGQIIRRKMDITTMQRVASAQARAGGVKLDTGFKSITDSGSKLRNQIAVNSTQNIDASVAQQTTVDILTEDKDATFMQIYDAFMGDAASFGKIRKQANKNFDEINSSYELVQKEIESFERLIKEIGEDVGKKKARGEMYDIGLEGDYRSLGDFVLNPSRIIMRDMPENTPAQQDAKEKALRDVKSLKLRGIARDFGISLPAGKREVRGKDMKAYDFNEQKKILIPPDLYLEFIKYAFKALNIESDLRNFLSTIRKRKSDLYFNEILPEKRWAGMQYS